MKKKEYFSPEVEIEKFEIEDVIARSGPGRPKRDDLLDEEEELLGK